MGAYRKLRPLQYGPYTITKVVGGNALSNVLLDILSKIQPIEILL